MSASLMGLVVYAVVLTGVTPILYSKMRQNNKWYVEARPVEEWVKTQANGYYGREHYYNRGDTIEVRVTNGRKHLSVGQVSIKAEDFDDQLHSAMAKGLERASSMNILTEANL